MAIDPQRPVESDCFLRQEKKFYPQKFHLGHDQLKHFLNCPQTGRVYLVNRRNIYCIDTEKCRRTLVTELPFEARCTATGHGWLCVGGEDNGYFAAVKIPEGVQDTRETVRDNVDTGATWNESRDYWNRFERMLPPRIKIERLGDQLINSISIHRLERTDGQAEVTALVTNNDHSVRLWSLTNEVELHFDSSFPFAMNHATISPNGKLLVVVGDQEWAYLYQRFDSIPNPSDPSTLFRWEKLRNLSLHKPAGVEHSEYFTTAWSPNGRLLATASQQGYITVFDVKTLVDDESDRDPVVALIPSSRTSLYAGPGAVRTMCFAPEPWDLLLWTENNGRLGIGDLRTGLMTRQIVNLDPAATDVQRVDLADVNGLFEDTEMLESNNTSSRYAEQYYHSGRDSNARNALIRDYSAALLQERRQQVGILPSGSALGLTQEEWQRLEMLRTAREQEEAIRRGLDAQVSNVRRMPIPITTRWEAQREAQRQTGSSSEISTRADAFLDSIRNFARDHPDSINSVRTERAERNISQSQQLSQRRHSDILSAFNDRTASPGQSADPDPWRTIEAAIDRAVIESDTMRTISTDPDEVTGQNRLAASGMTGADSTTSLNASSGSVTLPRPRDRGTIRAELYTDLPSAQRLDRFEARRQSDLHRNEEELRHLQARQRIRQRERELYSNATLTRQLSIGLGDGAEPNIRIVVGGEMSWPASPDDGLETTGVAWDTERRVVYAGTVDGVFELKMNFDERKFWPSMQMR